MINDTSFSRAEMDSNEPKRLKVYLWTEEDIVVNIKHHPLINICWKLHFWKMCVFQKKSLQRHISESTDELTVKML